MLFGPNGRYQKCCLLLGMYTNLEGGGGVNHGPVAAASTSTNPYYGPGLVRCTLTLLANRSLLLSFSTPLWPLAHVRKLSMTLGKKVFIAGYLDVFLH